MEKRDGHQCGIETAMLLIRIAIGRLVGRIALRRCLAILYQASQATLESLQESAVLRNYAREKVVDAVLAQAALHGVHVYADYV